MRILVGLLLLPLLAAQSPEEGRIERNAAESILVVEGPRPVDSAAITLARRFGLRINVEDPPYICPEDKQDVSAKVAPGRLARPAFVPRGGSLRISFQLGADGAPLDPGQLVRNLVRHANETFPFQYELDESAGAYTLTPRATRDQLCNVTPYLPLLDRKVTIPYGTRPIHESAGLLAEGLSAQTGLRVGCCQSSVGGIPWGLEEVEIGADDEPARDVLRRLIAATLHGNPNPYFWLLRCDPHPSTWCFINLMHAPAAAP